MNFRFYIFGIPEGFDLYPNQGNANDIKYYQSFYDGSTENTRLDIRYNEKGMISYSYLKCKNIVSGSGRQGAFFGMSIVFENEYCEDVVNLLQLFDVVYQDILQKGILLKNFSDTLTRFSVLKLIDAESEIKRVENIIKVNLESQYLNDIKPINFPLPSNQNVIYKINSEKSNTDILSILKQYAIVSISPEYSKGGEEGEIIPQEIFDKLYEKIGDLDNQKQAFLFDTINDKIKNLLAVRDSLKGRLKKEKEQEIDKLYNEVVVKVDVLLQKCDAILEDLKIHLRQFPKHPILLGLKEHVNRHKLTLEHQKSAMKVFSDLIATFQLFNEQEEDVKTEGTNSDNRIVQNLVLIFLRKHKMKLIAVAIGVILIIVGIKAIQYYDLFSQNSEKIEGNENSTPKDNTAKLVDQGNAAFGQNNFDVAIEKFAKVKRQDLVDNAKLKAIEYWYAQAGIAKTLLEKRTCLEQAQKYGGYSGTKDDIAKIQKQIDDAAEIERNRFATKQKNDKGKGAKSKSTTNVIINLDPKKRVYSKGDTFTATAKSEGVICPRGIGEWRFEDGIYANKTDNPTTVEIKSVPSGGKAKLTYYIDNKLVATAEIILNP